MIMDTKRQPSFIDAMIPLVVLISLLVCSVILFGSDSSYGPNQIVLLLSAGVASAIGVKNGYDWKQIENAMVHGISVSMPAIFILLAVGSLVGTWMLSGTVPTLIYYGLDLLEPTWFYPAACLLSAVVAMSIGSSWTTAATIGVALMGTASGMSMSLPVTAGAVVSGAYFGDKLSPLSETTNLAPAVAGSELFKHIRHMTWTTIPSFLISLILFVVIGLNEDVKDVGNSVIGMQNVLVENYHIATVHLVPLILLVIMAVKRVPAFPAIFGAALLGAVWGLVFQSDLLSTLAKKSEVYGAITLVWRAMFDGFEIHTGNQTINTLLSRGGMSSMLNTVWLIITALMFGAVMEKLGLLAVVVKTVLAYVRRTGSLITSTIITAFGTNVVTADQYISIVMPGRMYKQEYERNHLDNVNLSRALEDGGTITSPLIPWNTCGVYMASVLLVNPLEYWQYAFFNLINPIMAILFAYLGIKVLKVK